MMKMHRYSATFWRGNPQLKNGGYETTRTIEAVNIQQARKIAREKHENGCVYGTLTLLDIKKED
jgi:hypothetical protein